MNMSAGAQAGDALAYQVAHVVLPTKLPQKDDFTPENDQGLVKMVLKAMLSFQDHLRGNGMASFSIVTKMIQQMQECRPVSDLDEDAVTTTLGNLADQGKYLRPGSSLGSYHVHLLTLCMI